MCHLHLKSCSLPDLAALRCAPHLEWLSLDSCDLPLYVPDLPLLWPDLSWLELTYMDSDWRMLSDAGELLALAQLTRLRKLRCETGERRP